MKDELADELRVSIDTTPATNLTVPRLALFLYHSGHTRSDP